MCYYLTFSCKNSNESTCSNLFDLNRLVSFLFFTLSCVKMYSECFLVKSKRTTADEHLIEGCEKYTKENVKNIKQITLQNYLVPSTDDLLIRYFDRKLKSIDLDIKKSNSYYDNVVIISAYDTNSKKILVVDDSFSNRKMISKVLNHKNNYCEDAPNGLIALNMVKATVDTNSDDLYLRNYDMIIMDIIMPVMDGIESTMEIRKLGFKGPIIGMTASIEPKLLEPMVSAGATKVLIKPFKIEEVTKLLKELDSAS